MRQVLVDPTLIRSKVQSDVRDPVVPQTISTLLVEANLNCKSHFRVLPLTLKHWRLRLHWYQARTTSNATDWQNVVFSGEFRFVLETDDNCVGVEAPW